MKRRPAVCLGMRVVWGFTSQNKRKALRDRSFLLVIISNRSLRKIRLKKRRPTHANRVEMSGCLLLSTCSG